MVLGLGLSWQKKIYIWCCMPLLCLRGRFSTGSMALICQDRCSVLKLRFDDVRFVGVMFAIYTNHGQPGVCQVIYQFAETSVMQLVVMQLSCHSLQVFRDSAMELLYGWQLIMNVRENPLLAATWHLSHEPCECRLWPIVFVVSVCLHFQSQQSVALFSLLLSAVFWHQSVQPCANAKWRLAMELPASRPAVSLIARQKRLFFIDCLKKKYPWLSDKTVAQLFPDEDIMFLSKRAWETKALHARQFAKFVETFIE